MRIINVVLLVMCWVSCDSGESVKCAAKNTTVTVEKISSTDSVIYYYSSVNNKLLCVEELVGGILSSLCMDRGYEDLNVRARVGSYLYSSYFSFYPGFKMIYRDQIVNAALNGDEKFESFVDSLTKVNLGVNLTRDEKNNLFYYLSR